MKLHFSGHFLSLLSLLSLFTENVITLRLSSSLGTLVMRNDFSYHKSNSVSCATISTGFSFCFNCHWCFHGCWWIFIHSDSQHDSLYPSTCYEIQYDETQWDDCIYHVPWIYVRRRQRERNCNYLETEKILQLNVTFVFRMCWLNHLTKTVSLEMPVPKLKIEARDFSQ